jgi:hypothetical protein
MSSKPNHPDRPRRLARRAHGERPWLSRAALSRAAATLTAEGKLIGDDDHDVLLVADAVEAASPHRRTLSDAWLDPARWPADAPLVHLDLVCTDDDNLAEEWLLPAPEAALVAAN